MREKFRNKEARCEHYRIFLEKTQEIKDRDEILKVSRNTRGSATKNQEFF